MKHSSRLRSDAGERANSPGLVSMILVGGLMLVMGAVGGYVAGSRNSAEPLLASPTLIDEGESSQPSGALDDGEAGVADGELVVEGDGDTATTEAVTDTDPLTIYVSPEGNDADDGQDPTTAFRSIEHAVANLQTGMTLYVMEGEYLVERQGPTLVPVVHDGTPEQWTRIIGLGDERPLIRARGGALFEALGSYIEISGLELRGENFGPEASYGYGILFGDGHHFKAVDNLVTGFPVSGIGAVRTSHIYIADNVVFDNSQWGSEQGSGLSVYHATDYGFANDENGYSDYFVNNVVYGNENLVTSRFVQGQITDGNGIIIDNGDETGYSGRTLVANNVVYGNGGRGIWAYASSRVDIVNNTVLGNVTTGEDLNDARAEIAAAEASDIRVVNNLAWTLNGMDAFFFDDTDGLVVEGNVGIGGITGHDGSGLRVLFGDEVLVVSPDLAAPDLTPSPGSLLVDSGVVVELPLEHDAAGQPRVTGSAIDIGAYEAAGS